MFKLNVVRNDLDNSCPCSVHVCLISVTLQKLTMKTAVILLLACSLLVLTQVTVEAAEIKRDASQILAKAEAEKFLNDAPEKIVKRNAGEFKSSFRKCTLFNRSD